MKLAKMILNAQAHSAAGPSAAIATSCDLSTETKLSLFHRSYHVGKVKNVNTLAVMSYLMVNVFYVS